MVKKIFSLLLALVMLLSAGAAAAESEGWTCPNCRREATGNFCSNCGTAKPSDDWVCFFCGTAANGHFCSHCGASREESDQAGQIVIPVTEQFEERNPVNAEETLTSPVGATLSLKMDRTILPLAGAFLQNRFPNATELLNAAANIVDQFALRGTWDDTGARLEVLLKEQPLAYAAVNCDGNTITIVSDILPNGTVIRTDAGELLRTIGVYYGDREPVLRFTPEDLKTVQDAVVSLVGKVGSDIQARMEAEETGSWTYQGKTFTSRRRLGVTTREIGVIMIRDFRDAVQDQQMNELLTRFGVDIRSMNLDEEIGRIEATPEANYAPLEAYCYSNEEGDTWRELFTNTVTIHYNYDPETGAESTVQELGDRIAVQYGAIGKDIFFFFDVPGKASISLKADSSGSNFDYTMEISGMTVNVGRRMTVPGKLHAEGRTAPDGTRSGTVTCQLTGLDLFTMEYQIRQGDKMAVSFETNGKQVLSASDIGSYSFSQHLTGKLLEIIGKVSAIMPEDAAKLLPEIYNLINR